MESSMITKPTWVKIRNFNAAYRRFGPPQIPIRKNIGRRTSSQKTAKRMKSRAWNTPTSAISRNMKRPKKARGRCSSSQWNTMARVVSRAVSQMRGTLRPSTPTM